MTVRQQIRKCLERGQDADGQIALIVGLLSVEFSIDNGNGWYDNDPEMADGGLEQAEAAWIKLKRE